MKLGFALLELAMHLYVWGTTKTSQDEWRTKSVVERSVPQLLHKTSVCECQCAQSRSSQMTRELYCTYAFPNPWFTLGSAWVYSDWANEGAAAAQ